MNQEDLTWVKEAEIYWPDEIFITPWPKCSVAGCDNDVDAYVYINNEASGYCHSHYDVPLFPSWRPETLNWLIKAKRRIFGWNGHA